MTDLIKKLFIKNSNDTTDPSVRSKYGFVAGIVGIVCNIFLFVIKVIAGLLVGSISIIADAINNLSDMGSSLITMIAFKMSGKPADNEHPYGHGRIEYISGLIVSIIIVFLGIELLKTSIGKIFEPSEVLPSFVTIIILAVSVLVKLWMSFFNRNFGKAINSASLKATATDCLNDVIATIAILISVIVIKIWGVNIDGYVGTAVSLYIFISGINMIKETISPLLGEKTDPETVMNILKIVNNYDKIIGIHDLVVHDYGPGRKFASLHAEVSVYEKMTIVHDVIDNCEKELFEKLGILVSIHMDPIETDNEVLNNLKCEVGEIISTLDPRLSFHDFRAVFGESHTNLIFDIVVPYDLMSKSNDLVKHIQDKILEKHPNHYCVIQIDNLYS